MTEEYVVVVRTYKRYDLFIRATYNTLIENNIDVENKLYIVVANEEEKQLYEKALGDRKYKGFIVAEVGIHNAIKYAVEYFEEGQNIVFMDDDLEYFYEWNGPPSTETFIKNSTNLEKYIQDGFKSLNDNVKTFTVSFASNAMFMNGKPWKEFRPYLVAGNFFGAKNSREEILVGHAHLEDIHRSVKYVDKYGGTILYNWAGFKTKTGTNPGGMQESGDRGTYENRIEFTKNVCDEIYKLPLMQKYCKPPLQAAYNDYLWEIRLKPINQIKKVKNITTKKWSNYFQETPDQAEISGLDEFL